MADASVAIGERTTSTMAPEFANDDALIARCKDGDEGAFAALYQQHAARVYRQLRSSLRDNEVEDALQQTFATAFRNIHKFEQRAKVSTWLYSIAMRVALNIIRSRRRRDRIASAFGVDVAAAPRRRPTSPEASMVRREDVDQLRRHLSEVPAESQLAFRLYYIEQFELGEVAERVGLSPAAAWARIKRARERILDAIAREQLRNRKESP
jgi:RNA polymerase sigma-70 factor (ECF subfamily)